MIRRVIAGLMSFYVLVLVFAPCVDHDLPINSTSVTEISSATLPAHQDQHDCCSPFCTCSCCSAPFELLKPFIISQDFSQNSTLAFFFRPSFLAQYDSAIWEPPKVS